MQHAPAIVRAIGTVLALCAAGNAFAGELGSADECKVGMRVSTKDGHKGQITRVDRSWSYCYVRQDDTGKEVGYLYSLLLTDGGATARPAAPRPAAGGKLVVGSYMCWVGSEASASGLKITGASTYESDGATGTYHMAGDAIVFDSGPFKGFNAKRLGDGRIGLNLTGGSFYNMTCDPPR